MTKINVQVIGAKSIIDKMERLSNNVAGEALERALVSGGLIIVNEAKQPPPRGAPYKTGNLRRSIHVGGYGAKGGLEVPTTGTDIGGNRHTRNSAEVLVGTNVEYAEIVEYGSSKRPASGFLRRAVDTQKNAAAKEVGEALKDLLRAAAR